KLQQPNLKVAQYRLHAPGRLRKRLQTGLHHAIEVVVGFMRWRKLNHEIAHVGEASERFRLAGKIKMRLNDLRLTHRYKFLIFLFVVGEFGKGEGLKGRAESAFQFAATFGNATDHSCGLRQNDNNLVRLAEVISSEHQGLGLNNCHWSP